MKKIFQLALLLISSFVYTSCTKEDEKVNVTQPDNGKWIINNDTLDVVIKEYKEDQNVVHLESKAHKYTIFFPMKPTQSGSYTFRAKADEHFEVTIGITSHSDQLLYLSTDDDGTTAKNEYKAEVTIENGKFKAIQFSDAFFKDVNSVKRIRVSGNSSR
jgi:hypothetical protein